MFILYPKLKTVKAKLKVVNKDLYASISQKVNIARQRWKLSNLDCCRGIVRST